MISRFFILSGLILKVNPVWLVGRILLIALVVAFVAASFIATFPRQTARILADFYEETIVTKGTAEEIQMLRDIRREAAK